MNWNRLVCLSGLLLCLLAGGYLRLSGADWGSGAPRSHRGMYAHPDERSVYDKTSRLQWESTQRGKDESLLAYWSRTYSTNFLHPQSGMNIDSYNYGSFPYYVLFGLSNWFNNFSPEQVRSRVLKTAFQAIFLLFLVWILYFFFAYVSKNRNPKEFPHLKFWGTGFAVIAIVTALAHLLAGYCFTKGIDGAAWNYQNWGKLARPLSGLAGVFTILYLYRIGARIYSRRVGLFAAILLTFTAMHLQLSHYFTFDVLQAFFCTAALYSLVAFLDAETWGRRWRAILATSIWTGIGMSTKFGSILLFIPWFMTLALAYWRHRPHLSFFSLRNIGFAAHLKLIGLVSFVLIWAVTFLTQPFGYLDYPEIKHDSRGRLTATSTQPTTLSFVHLNFEAGPKFIPTGLRSRLTEWGDWLDGYTEKVGVHFGWLDYHSVQPAQRDGLTIGGSRYWRDVTEQRRMALEGGFPWTRQYKNTTPFVYQWKNLIFWGMGIPLGLLCLFGVFYGFLKPIYKPTWTEWVILGWMIPNFFTTHLFHTKFPRYLTPQLPFFCLWAAALAVAVFAYLKVRESRGSEGRKGFGFSKVFAAVCIVVVGWSALYSFAYLKVFTGTHPWERASDWFAEEVPEGSRIVTEMWDDSVPTDPGVMGRYQHRTTNPIHSDSPQHMSTVCASMEWSDYYCFSSKRNYGAFLQAPEDGENRVRFYKSLFGGNLGYRLVKTFSEPVTVLGIPIRFELADESLSLYDHPTVHVFQKVEELEDEEILDRILHPPEWIDDLTQEQVLTATEDRSILAPPGGFALERWVLGILLLGWLFWPIAFQLFRGLPDGGLSASRVLAFLGVTYASWLGTSLGFWQNTRLATTLCFLGWVAVAVLCFARSHRQMVAYLKLHWKRMVFIEAVFLIVFGFFITLKMSNPDIYQGEKPMNIAFVNAAYRATSFPAIDPWYAGESINYYHYGHLCYGLLGKWFGVPPEYTYNLSVATIPAFVFIVVFGIIFNLTRSYAGGLIGAFLTVFAGTFKSVIQMASLLDGGPKDPKVFRERYEATGLENYLGEMWEQIQLTLLKVGFLLWNSPIYEKVSLAWRSTWNEQAMKEAETQRLSHFFNFDRYFWKLSRVTKSSVANEFPIWTHVFADFHAHQLIMPIGMVLVSLLVAFSIRQSGYWRMRGEGLLGEARDLYGGSIAATMQILFISLLLGMVFITNGWDYPALIGLTLFTFLMTYLYSWRDWWNANRFGFGRALVRMNIWGRGTKRLTLGKFGFIQQVVLPPIAVIFLSYALFYPFHRHFNPPKRVTGIGWMHQEAAGWITPYEFLQVFGIPFLILIPILVTWLWRWGTTAKWGGLKVLLTVLVSFAASAGLVTYFSRLSLKTFDPASLETPPRVGDSLAFWQYIDSEIAYLVFGVVLFFALLLLPGIFARRSRFETRWACLLLAVGLCIIAGCEVVYINEGWSVPLHRWNTVFKFHLQAWHFLGLGIGCFIGLWFQRPPETPGSIARTVGRFFRYAVGYPILIFALYLAVLFPMILPYFTAHGGGFFHRSRQIEGDVTLDGLNFLRHNHPDYAATIDFLRTHTEGQPTIVEVHGESYHHDRGWIATHTGLPTLIGWPHHVRERDHLPEPRIELVKTIYDSISREKVRDILRDHQVRFVIVGPTERQFYTSPKGLAKFEEWNDLFYPVFHSSIEDPGVTVYGVHPAYQLSEDWSPPNQDTKAATYFEEETGLPLLRGTAGFGGGEYREPRGLVVSSSGEILVADSMNHRVQAFGPKGNLKWILGEQGQEIGEFKEPRDLAVDDEARVHVLDTWNARVQVFSSTGDLSQTYRIAGGANGIDVGAIPLAVHNRETKELEIPDSPLFGQRMTFIANTAGKNILVINRNGDQTQTWGGGKIQEPVDAEVTSRGLAVLDARAKKVLWYDGRGRFLEEWDIPTEGTGNHTNEMKVAWDESRELLLVTDPTHDKLFVYTKTGEIVLNTTVGGGPAGVDVTPDGRVYVAAKREGRILLVPLPGGNR